MRLVHRSLFVAVATCLPLVLLAAPAAAGGGGGPCAGFSERNEIQMRDFCFSTAASFVEPGTKVVVTNDGQTRHDFVASDGSFSSGVLAPGASWELTATEPGIVRYYCSIHGSADGTGMAGILVVGNTTAQAPTAVTASVGSTGGVAAGSTDGLAAGSTDGLGAATPVVYAGDGDTASSLATALIASSTRDAAERDDAQLVLAAVALVVAAVALAVGLGAALARLSRPSN